MRWMKRLIFVAIALVNCLGLTAVAITIGNGTSSDYIPFYRTKLYCTYESIITQGEIAYAGNIRRIYFEKASGSDLNPIQNVTIYLKHTTETELLTGAYSATGYIQVYNGNFPNDVISGWVSVLLSTPFAYNNTDNLQILIIKEMQTALSTTAAPKYAYSDTTPYRRTRYAYSNYVGWNPYNLNDTFTRSNIRLEITSPAAFAVAPTAVDFGLHDTSDTIAPATLTVTNNGEEPLQIVSAELIGDSVFSLITAHVYPVDVNQGEELLYAVAFSPVNTGSYNATLTITDNLSRTAHIIAISGSAIRPAYSGEMITPISLLDTVNPMVTVSSPNGGETLYYNSQYPIGWTATDSHFNFNPITIMLSADDGSNYADLAINQSNSSPYLWIVPADVVKHAKIMIIATDSFGNAGIDESDGSFSLAGATECVTLIGMLDTVNPSADLLAPNGGENWYVGETHDITWTATDSHPADLPIKLEYEKVSTGNWEVIEPELANNGSFAWQTPTINSAQILVRLTVRDAFGNTGIDTSQSPFSIACLTPATPQNVDVQIVNGRDAVITWSPVTQTILGTDITPTTYLVLYNQTSDPYNEAAYYYLGENQLATGYTHFDAGSLAQHLFYQVVAVVDYNKRLRSILASTNSGANRSPGDRVISPPPLSWMELKRRLSE